MSNDPPGRPVELGTEVGAEFVDSRAAELTGLAGTVDNPPDMSIMKRFNEARVIELENKNKHRGWLVEWSLRAVGALATASTALMAAYAVSNWGHIEANVVIAYFTSVVAESVGILLVIARYLFPRPDKQT